LNEQIINWAALNSALQKKGTTDEFEKKVAITSYIIAGSFFLSSVLNYVLAKLILVSEPGTTAYTEELGKMTALSYPVIMVPSMIMLFAALWYIFKHIKKLTGEELDTFFAQ